MLVSAASAFAQAPAPAVDPFEGQWVGHVTAPRATAEIAFAFTRTPRGLGAKFAMPAMFVAGLNLGPAEISGDTYAMPELGITLTRAGDAMTGTFANPLLQVELRRGGAWPAAPVLSPLPPPPPIAWSRPLGARIWASPVAVDGVVYVGAIDGKFHAVRAADGEDLWSWSGSHPLYGEALLAGDGVYFVDDECALVCLARGGGALRWRVRLRDEKSAAASATKDPTFNHRTATPVFDHGTLYVGSTDGGVYALDRAEGKILWRHAAGAPIYAAVAIHNEELVAGCFDGTLLVLNRGTGAEIARTKIGGAIASAPVLVDDVVMVGGRDYLLYGLKRSDLAVVWRDSFWFSWIESVPRIVDGVAYVGGSDFRRVSAIDPATGAVRWATDVRGITWGQPVVSGDTVYAATSAQNPAAIRHEGGITALDRSTGEVRWRHVVPLAAAADRAGYLGSLVLASGKIIGADYDGVLVAFPAH